MYERTFSTHFKCPRCTDSAQIEVIPLSRLFRSGKFLRSVVLLFGWTIILQGCGGGGSSSPETEDPDLLFEENFTYIADGAIPVGWSVITHATATIDGPALWRVKSRMLRQSSNVHAPSSSGFPYAENYEGTMAVVGELEWMNIALEVKLIPHDDDGIGVVFRWQPSTVDSDGNFYRFMIVSDQDSGGPKARVDKRVDGVWTILGEDASTTFNYREGNTYRVEVSMVLDEFTIKLNDSIIFTFTDNSLTSGKVGLFCFAEEGADFDDIRVYRRGP